MKCFLSSLLFFVCLGGETYNIAGCHFHHPTLRALPGVSFSFFKLCLSILLQRQSHEKAPLKLPAASDGTQRICLSATTHVLLLKNNKLSKTTYVYQDICLHCFTEHPACVCACLHLSLPHFKSTMNQCHNHNRQTCYN